MAKLSEIEKTLQEAMQGFIGQANDTVVREAICLAILQAAGPLVEEQKARFREKLKFNVVTNDDDPTLMVVVPTNEFTARLFAGEWGE